MPEQSGAVAPSPQAGGGQGQNQQQQQQPSLLRSILMQMLFMYFISNWMRSGNAPHKKVCRNLFKTNQTMDLLVYLSESEKFSDFEKPPFWKEEGLIFGSWTDGPNADGTFGYSANVTFSEAVLNNGSLYLHAFLTKEGYSPDPASENYERFSTVNVTRLLTRYRPERVKKTANLLTGKTDDSTIKRAEEGPRKIISYWHPNLTINVLDDQTNWPYEEVPAPLNEFFTFDNESASYFPVVYLNDYWNLAREHQPINSTTPELPLNLQYAPLSLMRWQMYLSQSMRPQWMQWMGDSEQATDEEQDSLKETMMETSPYLLALTVVVSLLHTAFEFLAFKNDVQFWRTRKSLEGLSVRSVFVGVIQSVIVLLYVLDNDTNTMVVISVFIGLLIDLWKVPKVINFTVDRENQVFGIFPRISGKFKTTYVESPTKKYDEMAFKYLGWVLFPLFIGYAVYSLLYHEHKGWYSFILGMCYGFLLTFGFIMMTPQLFINYKLKSVAHLPWRMMTYKALNTFIDDIFAFVIRMPTLYRLGCLRDDVIFFIFLYQRWVYRVDHTRVNEFGVSGEDLAAGSVSVRPGTEAICVSGEEGSESREEASEDGAKSEPKSPDDKKND